MNRAQALADRCLLDPETGCWDYQPLWSCAKDPSQRRYNARYHRKMWEAVNGPIPEGKFVLHHCDNPGCINPDHLWIGTHSDNMIDMFLKGRGPIPKRMTHCYRGHEFTPENTMSVDKGRKRKCRTCNEINLARKLVAHRQRLGKSLDLQF